MSTNPNEPGTTPPTAPWTGSTDRGEQVEAMFPPVDPYPAPPSPTLPSPATATASPAAAATPAREIARGPRPGTVLWGLIVIAAGVIAIVAATDVALDLELTAIVGLAVAGVLLLVTALVSSARNRGRSRD